MQIQTDDKCKLTFDELKFKKNARYVVYQILNQRIVVQRVGARQQNWDQFLGSLPDNQYRYCVFDFQFKNQDNMNISKLLFVNWSPEKVPIKGRMLYATARQAFKTYLDMNTKDWTVQSKGDLTQNELTKELSK